MALRITNKQREPYLQALRDEFRVEVIAHARRKAVFAPALTDDDYEKIAQFIYARVDAYLKNHEAVTYDSYVRMMLVYFIRGTEQVEGPDMQATLLNEHFDINTRVQCAYDITKLFMERGF
jgi:hypothetical protein